MLYFTNRMFTPSKVKIVCLLCLVSGLILGFFSRNLFVTNNLLDSITEIRNRKNYKFINPLLECDSNNISRDKNLDFLKNKLELFVNEQIKTNPDISFTSIYYRDLNNGPWIGINERELFSPASLIKVPLLITYYKLAENNPDILDNKIVNTELFNPKDQNIVPEITLSQSQEYTVSELLDRMIIYSDNQAYDLLLKNIDNRKLIETYNNLGVDISLGFENPNGNILSVKQYASFFRILFNASYLSKDMSEKTLGLLSRVKFSQALVAGVPSNILVAHKFGERQYTDTGEKQLHDCGIIYLPNKPYLLCIMTRGKNIPIEENFVKQISSMVYQNISGQ
ncbi:hypothetical protein COY20_02835 [Candidatus Shapirobacteria bacterium CG_4_10_14_0_2_um_filter_40_12]|uniref:Beta-lactamase class A catalytic domain-containing protein n=1 Tax=Candidatus Shapirobacteria bacterium CG_4_10_14_0_2_um_filter_40_12 TaxID=1974871 RepID=A0A2M7TTB7_9BACT|nr:MAG: hypothetical protein COY20_02835 [Candidatus Shapirobacteria bacterium CG_4_10_14_0_2_um_filter_40_12]